jgi:trans-2-enoyl-CoA reductase
MAFNYFDIAHAIETHDFIINEDDFSEELRLKIIDAINQEEN